VFRKVNLIAIAIVLCLAFAVAPIFAEGKQEAAQPTSSSGSFSWTKYAGTTIVVQFMNQLQYEIAAKLIPDFMAQTGIKVEIDWLDAYRAHEKQLLEMTKPVGDYDIVPVTVTWKTEYYAAKLLAELEPMFANPGLTAPNYDFKDFVPVYVDATSRAGGEKIYLAGPGSKLYGVPFATETSILAYRTDVFANNGFQAPDTYDQLRKINKAIGEQSATTGIYGLTMRGQSGHQCTHAWLLHADPFGAKIFDKNWNPIINSQESIDTLNFMKEVVQYGPPGITGFTADDQHNSFLQGKASMFIDTFLIAGTARLPDRSKIIGKVGFALHPKQKTRLSELGGNCFSIPANSKNKEAAFLFLQWMTSKENDKRLVLLGGNPARVSTISDPELVKKYPEFLVLKEQIKYADADWRPLIQQWTEVDEQYVGIAVSYVLTGMKTPKQAMDDMTEPLRALMQKYGYYNK
jgi:multiple sugar transport system substrate-binding protein